MKPVAKPEVLGGGPHLVAKSETAFPAKEDWQVVFNSKAPFPPISRRSIGEGQGGIFTAKSTGRRVKVLVISPPKPW